MHKIKCYLKNHERQQIFFNLKIHGAAIGKIIYPNYMRILDVKKGNRHFLISFDFQVKLVNCIPA